MLKHCCIWNTIYGTSYSTRQIVKHEFHNNQCQPIYSQQTYIFVTYYQGSISHILNHFVVPIRAIHFIFYSNFFANYNKIIMHERIILYSLSYQFSNHFDSQFFDFQLQMYLKSLQFLKFKSTMGLILTGDTSSVMGGGCM